jgi:hypothetical protein
MRRMQVLNSLPLGVALGHKTATQWIRFCYKQWPPIRVTVAVDAPPIYVVIDAHNQQIQNLKTKQLHTFTHLLPQNLNRNLRVSLPTSKTFSTFTIEHSFPKKKSARFPTRPVPTHAQGTQFPRNAKTSSKIIFFLSSIKGMMINIRRTIHCGIHGKSVNTGLSHGRHLSQMTKRRKQRGPRQRRRVIGRVSSERKEKPPTVNVNTRRVRLLLLSTNGIKKIFPGFENVIMLWP